MGLWELQALSAVKQYAIKENCSKIYMVPAHVKAHTADRPEYFKGSDTALEHIYEKIPALAGFHKVQFENLPQHFQGVTKKYACKYLWYATPDNLRTASKKIILANGIHQVKLRLGLNGRMK
jgi:hypothetical protein